MRKSLIIILQLSLIIFLYSCKATKHLTSTVTPSPTGEAYINYYKDIAISEMKRTGIPASITLAQGMIESDYGRSTLAREANNHFGIKCHNDWAGPKVYHNDDRNNECFRKYARPEDSFYDHSDFLRSGSRYSFLFSFGPSDYKAWAHGLRKAGYATNPDYANMLIRKIEEENLAGFDSGDLSAVVTPVKQPPAQKPVTVQDSGRTIKPGRIFNDNTFVAARVPRIMENNSIQYIVVKDGDTREKIENEFQLLKWELPRYNDLKSDFPIVPGQILYLQAKKERAETGKEFYTAVEGDTMYLISQRYGIKLKSLYKMNRMGAEIEPEPGSKIWLRSTKPEK